ncbi:MAG: two-component system response regulator AtoC [Parvicellaceae bacterium]|jgi:two-component system response regulator AtoC
MKIAIIEDDQWYSQMLKYQVSLNPDFEVQCFETSKSFFSSRNRFDLIIMDFGLPDISGEDCLKRLLSSCPQSEVIVVSGQEDVRTAITLLNNGAYDYIVKDDDTKERLWNTINIVLEKQELKERIVELEEEVINKYAFGNYIKGNSQLLIGVFKLMEKACKTNINVSIYGETGTGKELVAKAIHYNSDRKKSKFVAVNVSAIPSELLESELFGYEKGAFTGANSRRIGKFEAANKGTLFLDEIGDMDIALQAKLLRVLQERELSRIGDNSLVKLDIRIICATHKNLQEEVKNGNFREDLYYRLIGLPIELPALRKRKEDILILAKFFIKDFQKQNKLAPTDITQRAQDRLLTYNYPGNVRELRALVELSCAICENNTIDVDDINFHAISSGDVGIEELMNQELTLKEYSNEIIRLYLNQNNNNVIKVAQILDVGKSTIYRLLQEQKELV